MNIHEHQAKEILKNFGAPVSNGITIFDLKEIKEKIKLLSSDKLVVKAQIHAGGRGKAGGVKLAERSKIEREAEKMFGKTLVTHQTGQREKSKRIYIQEAYDIEKELYLSCLIDRESSKIAFISSTEGGVDIEAVAKKSKKNNNCKGRFKKISFMEDMEKIIKIFSFNEEQKKMQKIY